MANGIHTKLKRILISSSFLGSDPIWVCAIACRMDLDEEAKLAIQHTYQLDPIRDISPPLDPPSDDNRNVQSPVEIARRSSRSTRRRRQANRVPKASAGVPLWRQFPQKFNEENNLCNLEEARSRPADTRFVTPPFRWSQVRMWTWIVYFASILDGIKKLTPVPDH